MDAEGESAHDTVTASRSEASRDDDEYLPQRQRPARAPSPVWDIELDLNDTPPASPKAGPSKPSGLEKRRRSPSIEWDIEKDLDDDVESRRKRQLLDDDFGAPTTLLET